MNKIWFFPMVLSIAASSCKTTDNQNNNLYDSETVSETLDCVKSPEQGVTGGKTFRIQINTLKYAQIEKSKFEILLKQEFPYPPFSDEASGVFKAHAQVVMGKDDGKSYVINNIGTIYFNNSNDNKTVELTKFSEENKDWKGQKLTCQGVEDNSALIWKDVNARTLRPIVEKARVLVKKKVTNSELLNLILVAGESEPSCKDRFQIILPFSETAIDGLAS